MVYPVAEVAVSAGVSTAVATSVSAEPLLTALITLGVSIVTVLGGEAVKLGVAWLQKKRHTIEKQDPKFTQTENDKEKEGDK